MKICIVIPAHNESARIGALLDDLRDKGHDVVVIDDGSSDETGPIARARGAVVLRHDAKKGKGISLQDGFAYAVQNQYDAVITMDGDGQHAVGDIDGFVREFRDTGAGIVNGTRMSNHKGMPLIRLWTNRFMSWMVSSLCKQTIPDTQCGFRLIRTDVLKKAKFSSSDFEIETEVLIKASRLGEKIRSVPIRTIYRGELSKIHPVVDTIRFFSYIIREMRSS